MGTSRCRRRWAFAFCVVGFGTEGCLSLWRTEVGFVPATHTRDLHARCRARAQPPQLSGDGSPDDLPVETGRNPRAVATEIAWGIVNIPLTIIGLVAAYLLNGVLSASTQAPPQVPLTESLSALIAIEDDYAIRGPKMGLRQRLTRWFQWAEPNRRVDFEIKDIPNSPLKEKIRQRGKDAAEDIAQTVEYFVAGNGIIDDAGSGRMADRIAADEAARGYPEAEAFAEKALHEGRKALAETVSMLQEALDKEADEE
mmetsp:Transcript_44803/g.104402  ORF Transcript_44803/g.104402 Transcript_44803/m.104402 type:complete len:255 (+) Transcript_44803:56-820(+)